MNSPLDPAFSTQTRLADPDACLSLITAATRDLNADQGHVLQAQLVLLLTNHIADINVLRAAIAVARASQNLPPAVEN